MRTRISTAIIAILVVILLIGAPGSTVLAAPAPRCGMCGGGGGGGGGGTGGTLSQAERDGLAYMREEEKLAHDVYINLYAMWGMGVFYNISHAEANHTAAVKTLLDRYGIADPAAGKGAGAFSNTILQGLYTQLIKYGNLSKENALLVGGAVEEIDILDLEKYLAQTSRTDIISTYSHLKMGSCNHLRAFSSQYRQLTNKPYTPQYMHNEDYQAIINGGC